MLASTGSGLPYVAVAAGGRLVLLAVQFGLQPYFHNGAAGVELVDTVFRHIAYAAALFCGAHAFLWEKSTHLAGGHPIAVLIFAAALVLADTVLSLPAPVASFVVGIPRRETVDTTLRRFGTSCASGLAVGGLHVLLVASVHHPIHIRALVLIASVCLLLLLAQISPQPEHLRRGSLRTAVLSLAERVGVRARAIVIASGPRGVRGGAVPVDRDLLVTGRDDLVLAAVAHELAHVALWHNTLGGFLFLFPLAGLSLLLVYVVEDPALLVAFGFPAGSGNGIPSIILALHVLAPAEILLRPAAAAFRRWITFRADEFAAGLCLTAPLCQALKAREPVEEEEVPMNLLEQLWHQPVPSAKARIARLQRHQFSAPAKKVK